MKSPSRVSILLACIACAGPAFAASEIEWQHLYDQALQHYAAQEYSAAEADARRALALAREGAGQREPFVASSLNALALARQAEGHIDEATDLFGQALAIDERALGAHANTAAVALNLGGALEAQGHLQQALAPFERGLAIADGLPDAGALRHQALAALARVHSQLGHDQQAQSYDQRLLSGAQGLPAADRAAALERQARMHEAQGDLDGARGLLEQALPLREQQSDETALVAVLTALADVLDRQARNDDAEPLHRRAMGLLQASDPHSLALAAHLNELALWHLGRHEYVPAQALLQRAQAIVEAGPGPQSLEAARIVANQALVYEEQGTPEPARALHQRALAIYALHGDLPEALLGQAQALNYLAGAVYREHRFGQAEPMFLQALGLMERAVGPVDARLLPVLANLEAVCRSQNRGGDAARYAERAARLRDAQRTPP